MVNPEFTEAFSAGWRSLLILIELCVEIFRLSVIINGVKNLAARRFGDFAGSVIFYGWIKKG